jgi:ATP-dependent RNA helicase DHX8/PRP22
MMAEQPAVGVQRPSANAFQHRPWEDPLPEAGERHLAQELRGVGLTTYEQPEWKTAALGKATTYGMSDARSMKDQRESLPIYKLKDQLVQAVNDNQARAF